MTRKSFWLLVFIALHLIILLTVVHYIRQNSAAVPLLSRWDKFSTPAEEGQHHSHRLVRIIHQSWKTASLPSRFRNWSASWRRCFPSWEYKLWTDEDNRRLIEHNFPWFLPTYDAYPANIYRADVVRYFYMYQHGGLYTDLDNECLRPFEHLLANASVVFGAMEGTDFRSSQPIEGYTQNSFFYSEPGHPLWLELIARIFPLSRVGNETRPEYVTGPVVLFESINAYRKRVGPTRNDIKIYPPHYFNPFSWMTKSEDKNCKSLNAMTIEELRMCRRAQMKKGAYVVQYHTQTWRDGKIL